jgi:pectin methylesterase-like acyl-CoA thioesterase
MKIKCLTAAIIAVVIYCITLDFSVSAAAEPPLSDDRTLSSLTVSPGTLDPVFDPLTVEYIVNVGYDVTSVDISATPNHPAASLRDGDIGTKALNVGLNTFEVEVTAESGIKLTYRIEVYRSFYSLQTAINNANAGETIEVPAGIVMSLERVIINKPNLTINGNGSTVRYSVNTSNAAMNGGDEYERNVVKVEAAASGLTINNLIIENSASYGNSPNQEATALLVLAENCRFTGVTFKSYLCTLEIGGSAVFKNCTVMGNLDFIYSLGTGTQKAYFKDCDIIRRYTSYRANGGFLRISENADFLFSGCNFTAEDGISLGADRLARYTSDTAAVRFIDCNFPVSVNSGTPFETVLGYSPVTSYDPLTTTVFSDYGTAPGTLPVGRPVLSQAEANTLEAQVISYFGSKASDLTPTVPPVPPPPEPEPVPEPVPEPFVPELPIPNSVPRIERDTAAMRKIIKTANGLRMVLGLTSAADGEAAGSIFLPLTNKTEQILTGLYFESKQIDSAENYITRKWETEVLGSFETEQKGGWGSTAVLSISLKKLGFTADDGAKLYAIIYDTKTNKRYLVAATVKNGNVLINTKRSGIFTIVDNSVA